MKNSEIISPDEQITFIQEELNTIDLMRRQLFHFVPSENNLVMTFTLQDGNQVNIPIQNPYKTRMFIEEVRTYLGEQELVNERKLSKIK
ncbi:hypothetical protein AHMF7605_23755 [Adhaeribacter arboris]|uniref:Uncharacterized protein n=1 Tax=Adhaeribacter arboris TaxID=2072846 RepID=A0A2T2YLC9_9BACT|nr:hypothetical protein [Adhaeribacter arboris]PSR56297.1 hypothetical protein AHMF7605_23755 [Adhaeribacter arboris]